MKSSQLQHKVGSSFNKHGCPECINGYVTVYDSNDNSEWREPCQKCNPYEFYNYARVED